MDYETFTAYLLLHDYERNRSNNWIKDRVTINIDHFMSKIIVTCPIKPRGFNSVVKEFNTPEEVIKFLDGL